MSDIIRHTDIAEAGALKPLQDELLATIKILNTLEGDVKAVATAIKTLLTYTNTGSVKGLDDLANKTRVANQAFTEQEKISRSLRDANARLNEVNSQMAQDLAAARLELERANAANKEAAKLTSETTGAYEKATIKLNQMRKAYKDLAISQKENTAAAKQLKSEIDQLDTTIKKIDASVGQHQRNVGNYASGFSGLRNSINQVTREMPAFVNSAQTGFMAISNNLPILIDQITALKRENAALALEGQKGIPVWKQVVSGFLSWQTALGIGITLMVTYGKEIGNAVKGLLGFGDATEEATEQQKQFNDALEAGNKFIDKRLAGQIREIEFRTKIAVANAKLAGKSQAEIAAIEEKGRQDTLRKLEEAVDAQTNRYGAALERRMQLEAQFNRDQSEENKKLLDEAIRIEQGALDARDAAQLVYENKKLEYIYNGLDKQLKAIEDVKKSDIKAIKERIDEYARLIAEMEKYGQRAEEIQYEIAKATIEYNKKLEEERAKAVPREALDEYQKEVNKGLSDIAKKREKAEQKDENRQDRGLQRSINALENASRDRIRIREDEIDSEISLSEKRQEQLRELALRGSQDAAQTLAQEERKQAELEAKKIRQQKNLKRQELLFAGLRAYTANLEANPATALSKTLKDVTALTGALAALPTFIEGTENVADALGKPHLPGEDGYIVRVDGKERILNPEQNRRIGDMSNDELTRLAELAQMGIMPSFMSGYVDDRQVRELGKLRAEISDLKEIIRNRPVKDFRYSEVEKMAVDITRRNHTTEQTRRRVNRYG